MDPAACLPACIATGISIGSNAPVTCAPARSPITNTIGCPRICSVRSTPLRGFGRPARGLELTEDVVANREPLVQVLETQRVFGKGRISEVVGLGARRQDQVVVIDRTVVGQQTSRIEVDSSDRRLQELRV